MKKFLLVISLLVAVPAHATSKSEVLNLAENIFFNLYYNEHSEDKLFKVKEILSDAWLVLIGEDPVVPDPACVDYMLSEVKKDGINNTGALSFAHTYCDDIRANHSNLNIVKFFYDRLLGGKIDHASGMGMAVDYGRGMRGNKLNCLLSAYERYREDGHASSLAVSFAKDFCK